MSEIERITLILSMATGLITLFLQMWQRRDESKIARSQIELEAERHKLDIQRAGSDINQQQADIQMRVTETLDAQIKSTNERYEKLCAEFEDMKQHVDETFTEATELFDEFETIVAGCKPNGNGNGGCSNPEMTEFLKKIRRFRRKRAI